MDAEALAAVKGLLQFRTAGNWRGDVGEWIDRVLVALAETQRERDEADAACDVVMLERDSAEDAIAETHVSLGGDGEWATRIPEPPPPDSGNLRWDVPELARLVLARAAAAEAQVHVLRDELRLARIEWESACERDRVANALREQAEEERDIALRVQIAMADGAKRSAESAEARAHGLAAEVARLREDLHRYGWHRAHCSSVDAKRCDCGLDAALAVPDTPKE